MKIRNLIFMVMLTAVVGFSGGVAGATQVQKSALSPLESDISELSTRVIALEDGGAQIDKFTAGGLLTSLGLQPGDIILNVNGQKINSALSFSDAVSLESQRVQGMMIITLERAGESVSTYCEILP